jgi:hypothetical protein
MVGVLCCGHYPNAKHGSTHAVDRIDLSIESLIKAISGSLFVERYNIPQQSSAEGSMGTEVLINRINNFRRSL